MKNSDALTKFLTWRDAITAERETIINRLREIDAALGYVGFRGRWDSRPAVDRFRNERSLKETLLMILPGKSLTKFEILDAVIASGYKFTTQDPLNCLGVVLYGKNPKFKNEKGRFSLKK